MKILLPEIAARIFLAKATNKSNKKRGG